MIRDYLIKNQPLFYRIIKNQFTQNKIPHAFLLNGMQSEEPLQFLKMSLICNDTLACETCVDCRNVLNGKYVDIIEFDGKEESIKKGHIERIQSTFKTTSLAGKNRIYVLKNIDNSSTEAMNSLLKMLEEPQPGIYAIFTTNNINKILPTIISRCQVLDIRKDLRETFKQQLVEKGYTLQKANLLSYLVGNMNEVDELDHDSFDDIVKQAVYFVDDMFNNRDNLIINTQIHMIKDHKEKKEVKLFLQMLILAMKDMFHVKHNEELVFCEHKDMFYSLQCDNDDIIKKIELLLETLNLIDTNANIPLLMDSMMYRI